MAQIINPDKNINVLSFAQPRGKVVWEAERDGVLVGGFSGWFAKTRAIGWAKRYDRYDTAHR